MKVATCSVVGVVTGASAFQGAITICWDFLVSLSHWQGTNITHWLTQLLLLWEIGNILRYCAGVPASLEKIKLVSLPHFFHFFLLAVLWFKVRVFRMLGKCCTTELHPNTHLKQQQRQQNDLTGHSSQARTFTEASLGKLPPELHL